MQWAGQRLCLRGMLAPLLSSSCFFTLFSCHDCRCGLHSASGHCEVITHLLKRGASAAHVARDGSSALTWASAAGHAEASSMVMSAGAPKDDFL